MGEYICVCVKTVNNSGRVSDILNFSPKYTVQPFSVEVHPDPDDKIQVWFPLTSPAELLLIIRLVLMCKTGGRLFQLQMLQLGRSRHTVQRALKVGQR